MILLCTLNIIIQATCVTHNIILTYAYMMYTLYKMKFYLRAQTVTGQKLLAALKVPTVDSLLFRFTITCRRLLLAV